MGIGAVLKKLIYEKGSNVNEVSLATGVSTSTLYSIIRRDSMSVNISDLYKVAKHLGVSLDYFYLALQKDDTSATATNTDIFLLAEEKLHIKKYRTLTPEGKSAIDSLIDTLLAMQQPPAVNDLPDINEARRRLAEIEAREQRAARLIAYKGKDNPTPVVYPTDEEVEAAKKLLEKDTIDFDNLD